MRTFPWPILSISFLLFSFISQSYVSAVTTKPIVDAPSSNVLSLRRQAGQSGYSSALGRRSVNSSKIESTAFGKSFSTNITIGNQSFEVIVDTGSSNLWVVESGYKCLNVAPAPLCNTGPAYHISPTFERIANSTFNEIYGSGEAISGIVGYEEVSIAGIKLKKQEIGLATNGSFIAPGKISGLVGLAYPGAHTSDNQLINPIFENICEEHLVSPLFSLALDRIPFNTTQGPGGYLALGGLPPVSHNKTFARTPIITLPGSRINATSGKPRHEWYSIIIEGVSYGSRDGQKPEIFNNTHYEMIIDTGTAPNVFPPMTASAINAQFDPPAVLDPASGVSVVKCDAKVPRLGVKIGGITFYHESEDLIITDGTGVCYSAIVPNTGLDLPGIGFVNILGDAFLKNVLAVFDVGGTEMRFAAREDY